MKTNMLSLALAFAIGCSFLGNAGTYVLEIAGEGYLLEDFDAYLEYSLPRDERTLRSELKAALFDQFVEEQLLLRSAREEGIEVSDAAVRAQLDGGEPEVSDSSMTPEVREERVADRLRVRRLLATRVLSDLSVNPEEIETHYKSRRADYRRLEVVDVSQILLETREAAEAIYQQLLSDPAKFEELARSESTGPEATMDGRMGRFSLGQLPPSLEREVFKLEANTLSEVVSTDFGFHIFKVTQRTPSRELALEDVSDAIQVELLRNKSEAAMGQYIAELKRKYPIIIHPDRLNFQYSDSMGWQLMPGESTTP